MNEAQQPLSREASMIDYADNLPESENVRIWEGTLKNLADVITAELKRQKMGEHDALSMARKLVAAQSLYMGGRPLYIPTGRTLFSALRDYEIFTRWNNGEPPETLRRDYHLSTTQIYAVIRHWRKITHPGHDSFTAPR
ncbi:transcriptional regulator [Salmonella enterica subsp. enterica]|nr:transcriptional regulator [Salmonella enterica subsp. enterica serovar Potsdam]